MRDSSLIARGLNLNIPDADLTRIKPALENLETAFAHLRLQLRPQVEPAVMFRAAEDAE